MKIVLQRVSRAAVTVEGNLVGSIGRGVLLFLGIHADDTEAQADFLSEKCAYLRIFRDESGAMNHSLLECGGEALVVSQFTLFGDCRKGRRPSFITAAPPDKGKNLYEYFVSRLKRFVPRVETGVFGAMMEVDLINDGPVTLLLER